MDNMERVELEEEHYQRLRQFQRDEEMVEDMRHQFSVRTGQLVDMVRQAYQGSDTFERDRCIAQLQENLESYRHHCRRRLDEIEEAVNQEKRLFHEQMEESSLKENEH
ncbi:hypothetical protein HO447_10475 [Streptococcus suis]|nr:hypothetical protein [Streptococcus suis]